ncbi:hypothetical protein BWQ96_00742 [Gracilariopsis chorda]|uniref:F-box domain-containing protein n=1 Tax=Gracilariopsis chorda TaxID=448386 RepID=A0A2V3J4P3_9FLOR|nr:hypothetical protein BWQ96_00742 [Gracilariopsis chorda]|eukprot:PXF49426.1 hypothetical protein BWQ96_00742 [Gracilariopsis chorda]
MRHGDEHLELTDLCGGSERSLGTKGTSNKANAAFASFSALAMGNNRRSTVNRLPKAERSHPQSKVRLVRDAFQPSHPTLSRPIQVRSASSPTSTPSSSAPFSTHPTTPQLNDHCLQYVLRLAGSKAVLTALDVNAHWRQVAREMLHSTTTLDLSSLYRSGKTRATPPTSEDVQRTLHKFTNLHDLRLKNWPYLDTHPQILRTCVDMHIRTLCRLHLEGVPVHAEYIIVALTSLQNLDHLHLSRSDTIDDRLLQHIASSVGKCPKETCALSNFVLSSAGKVRGSGVSAIIRARLAPRIKVTHCNALIKIQGPDENGSDIHLEELNLSSNRDLGVIELQKVFVEDLNLSQCPAIFNVAFDAVTLKRLNLSGSIIHNRFVVASRTPRFQKLTTLNLFGTRGLSRSDFRLLYTAEHSSYQMLSKLDLNGTSIQDLVLEHYANLQHVDCSGCRSLSCLIVRDCCRLERLVCNGKRMPLTHVELILPSTCTVDGMRPQWNWVSSTSHKSIFFGANLPVE